MARVAGFEAISGFTTMKHGAAWAKTQWLMMPQEKRAMLRGREDKEGEMMDEVDDDTLLDI